MVAVELGVVHSLLPLDEESSQLVASTDDRASALNIGLLLLLLSLGDHLREGLGETSVHLLDVLSTLGFLLITLLLLASTLLGNTTLQHGTTHLLELRFLLLGDSLLKCVVLTFHLGTHFLNLISSQLAGNHLKALGHVFLLASQDFITSLVHLFLNLGSLLFHGLIQVILKLSQLFLVLSDDSESGLLELLFSLVVNFLHLIVESGIDTLNHFSSNLKDQRLFLKEFHDFLQLILLEHLAVSLEVLLLFAEVLLLLLTDSRVFLELKLLELILNERKFELLLGLKFGQSVFKSTSLEGLDEIVFLFVDHVLNLFNSNHAIKSHLTLESADILGKFEELLRHKDLKFAIKESIVGLVNQNESLFIASDIVGHGVAELLV